MKLAFLCALAVAAAARSPGAAAPAATATVSRKASRGEHAAPLATVFGLTAASTALEVGTLPLHPLAAATAAARTVGMPVVRAARVATLTVQGAAGSLMLKHRRGAKRRSAQARRAR